MKTSTRRRIADSIKELEPGRSFIVATRSERVMACQIASTLQDAGVIDFRVVTMRVSTGDSFLVLAVREPPQHKPKRKKGPYAKTVS